MSDAKQGTPKWIAIGAGLLGLVAAGMFLIVRYYEIKKTKHEADQAEIAAEKARAERESSNGSSPPKEPKLKPGDSLTNSLGMKFAWIPPGNFVMGSPVTEEGRNGDETQHKVTLTKGFFLGIYPVTQAVWKKVLGNNPSRFQGDDFPVENVTWNDCQQFLRKLSAIEGHPYRLPTEAEWEYACRAGTITPFSFGETISTEQVNYNGNFPYAKGKKGVYREKTTPIGSFPANAWGLFDMHGNVWEWCSDWYGDYPQGEIIDPEGPFTGTQRSLRGGAFSNSAAYVRSASRDKDLPTYRIDYVGFRVARSN